MVDLAFFVVPLDEVEAGDRWAGGFEPAADRVGDGVGVDIVGGSVDDLDEASGWDPDQAAARWRVSSTSC